MIELSVIDTLDRMGATPWRLRDLPYEACLAIDVGRKCKYWAMSLLVCRPDDRRPSFLRLTNSWPKYDSGEEINQEILSTEIQNLLRSVRVARFDPLGSLLVLRDGRECGQEHEAIDRAVQEWRAHGYLAADAVVDVVDVHKHTVTGVKTWAQVGSATTNVLEGQVVYLDGRTALVNCTGSATLAGRGTADPCMLVGRSGTDMQRVATAFFWLSQLNYSSPSKAHRLAQPLRETDAELDQKLAQEVRGVK
jgi:hypothetical protein